MVCNRADVAPAGFSSRVRVSFNILQKKKGVLVSGLSGLSGYT